MTIVGRDEPKCRAADAREIHGLADAAMRRRRAISGQTAAATGDAAAPDIETKSGCPGNQNADKICHRRSGDEQPRRAFGKTEEPTYPLHDLPLDLEGDLIAPAEIRIESGGQHFRQHARRIAAAMHPAHEAGMGIPGRERKDVAHELVMHRGKLGRRDRHWPVKTRAHAIGDRLPNRALADVLEIIDDVVEHPVPLGTQARPICGIEGRAGGGRKAPFHRCDRLLCRNKPPVRRGAEPAPELARPLRPIRPRSRRAMVRCRLLAAPRPARQSYSQRR